MKPHFSFFVLSCLLVAGSVKAEEPLSDQDWKQVNSYINEIMRTGRSEVAVESPLNASLDVIVTPHKAVSRATGAICSAGCFDPCRPFDLQVVRNKGQTIYEFKGRKCASSQDFAKWENDQPVSLQRVLQLAPSGPDHQMIVEAQQLLTELGYYGFRATEKFDSETKAALLEFRADAQVSGPPDDITSADITEMRRTLSRSRPTGSCPVDKPFVACLER
ncbi:peptidoglycan-binding domain-containing protein [Consotaella salsifontis]|uniref:Putative peptidoglycan binding domain-containing protein n=1 Tax=Consotaella salsifontis TaxID=1365950 RepID=A0A1T4LK63_9HYPH|nr:peptidoglycan-binding protein [Consotaella salsifontis]SJZ55143.1 Putative peptidoglycan binding domain-containing protein [Consotaella salsifontis]